jgi:hypothetical protein
MTDITSKVVERHPAEVVTSMIEYVLDVSTTWTHWNGIPVVIDVEGDDSLTFTPHKAIRRVADHLVDHLAEIDARLAGRPTEPDGWHGSALTSAADAVVFTQDDLDEAGSRLRRLSLLWDVRLRTLSEEELDAPARGAWTIRQIALHVAESVDYADAMGRLTLGS